MYWQYGLTADHALGLREIRSKDIDGGVSARSKYLVFLGGVGICVGIFDT